MKTKQIVAFVVAAAVFMVTGVASVAINTWSSTSTKKNALKTLLMESAGSVTTPLEDYVAIIDIEGTLYSTPATSAWGESSGYNHPNTMKYVDQLMEDKYNKAILLNVNTPGGEVMAADDLYLKLMEYKEKTGRDIYCYFGSQACSGGYYIAMASDEIYANRNCWTGSIGVIISLTNLKGLYEKLGIEEVNITSGSNKDMGSAGKELSTEQYSILQSLVDEAYDQFVGIVADGRDLDESVVRKLADGRIYSAKQALENDLIDGICTQEEYFAKVQEKVGYDVEMFECPKEENPFASLFATAKELKPKSDAEVVTELIESEKMGGLMYYADILK